MSTVKATNIQNGSASVANAVTTSGGDLTNAAGVSFMGGSKNLLYNGAMQVAQRGTSTAGITTSAYYTADRWATGLTTLGTWTQSIEADAPTGSGFRNSLKMLCATAKASPAAGDLAWVRQSLEGQDLQRIAKGTASAQQLTLSFWVKSNITGTYTLYMYDQDNNRLFSASYSVSASATWERKTVLVPADTTGAFTNDNNTSLTVYFNLALGSTYTSGTLASSWATYADANIGPGQTNLAAATNNYWQITGVQLEVGPVASSFEFKSYGHELRECQRYYYMAALGVSGQAPMIGTGNMNTAAELYFTVSFKTTMRTEPTLSMSSGTNHFLFQRLNVNDYFDSGTIFWSGINAAGVYNSGQVSGTAGDAGVVAINTAGAYVAFSAEL